MKLTKIKHVVAALLVMAIGVAIGPQSAEAQRDRSRGDRSRSAKAERQIAWYGVLQDGLAEAERTGKPIFLTSAAPQCIGVSGMW